MQIKERNSHSNDDFTLCCHMPLSDTLPLHFRSTPFKWFIICPRKKYINDFVVTVLNDVMREKNLWKVCNEARTHYINELMAEMHSSLMGRTTNWTLVTIVCINLIGVRRHRSTDGRHHGLLAVPRTKRKSCRLINFTLTVCSGRPFLPFVHTPICIFARFRATCIAHIKCHSRFCLVCAVCASRPCTF